MRRLTLALVAASIVGCATRGEPPRDTQRAEGPDPRQGEQVDRVCFARTIDGFSHATANSVIISKSPNQQYRVETFGQCFDLDRAHTLRLDSFGSCLSPGDKILAYPFAPTRADSQVIPCPIKAIYQWTTHPDKDMAVENAD